jgi:hypothetical protein
MVAGIAFKSLGKTRQALQAAGDELGALQQQLFAGAPEIVARHALVMGEVEMLKNRYQEQVSEYVVQLNDGRWLWRDEYQAVLTLAANNGIDAEQLIPELTIEEMVIVEISFNEGNLKTLKGLEVLQSLTRLDVSWNPQLTSLEGVPVHSLEEVVAWRCGLIGDLVELNQANKLKILEIGENEGITSLRGVSLEALEGVDARWCNLTGDHSFLATGEKLERLRIGQNPSIALNGVRFDPFVDISW